MHKIWNILCYLYCKNTQIADWDVVLKDTVVSLLTHTESHLERHEHFWAQVTVCMEIHTFSLSLCGFSGFLPLTKNMLVGGLCEWVCECMHSGVFPSYRRCIPRLHSKSIITLTRKKRLLKMNELILNILCKMSQALMLLSFIVPHHKCGFLNQMYSWISVQNPLTCPDLYTVLTCLRYIFLIWNSFWK